MRVILLGGTFDPIHYGHVQILQEAMIQTQCDEGWFIPANQSPLKDSQQLSFETRAHFIELMIKDYENLKLCEIEKDLPLPNYSINTILKLKERYPDIDFVFLIGSDQGAQFNKWKEYQRILSEVEVVVYPRDNYEFENEFNLKMIQASEINVSSTQIREHRSFLTHPSILSEIALYGYYYSERLQTHCSQKLIDHTLRVAKLSQEIAIANDLDSQLAFGIAIAHDLYKQMDYGEMAQYLSESELWYPNVIWHGFVSSKLHSKFMKVKDKRFLEAVYHHTLGESPLVYSQIIYIADKCEPARKGKRNQEIVELSTRDLNAAFNLCKEEAALYQERKKNESN